MKLGHMRTFVTVAEEGTVSKAALRLRTAQPALSRQISDFEDELGLRLFDRVRRRLVLTGEGERLLGDCRSILAATEALGERARMLSRTDAGILKVAATMLDDVFGTFLHRYAERFPNVQIALSDMVGPADLFARLESGELHLGIGLLRSLQAETHQLKSFPLPSIEFLAAGHASVPLGSAGNIEVADLARFPLLLLASSFEVRKSFDDTCRVAGLKPRIFMESRLSHTLLALAESGHGVAIGPSTLPIHRYRLRVARVVHQGKPLKEPLAVMWNGHRGLPSYARGFCELLDAYMREVFPNLHAPARMPADTARRASLRRR
jgi:DNA-binding transcriptional LysR family regulator